MKVFLAKLAVTLRKPLANLVMELVAQAEEKIPGESGAAKKEYVIGKLDDLITLPWFLEPFDNAIFEVLIDAGVRLLNKWFGHNWAKMQASDLVQAAAKLKKALKK